MNIIIGLLVAGIIVAIIFLSRSTESKEEAREKYLNKIADFLGGKKNTIENYEDSFRIIFKYEGRDFIFEDLKEEGLGDIIFYRAYLKVRTAISLNLSFVERSKSGEVLHRERNIISTPKQLKEFMVLTNRPLDAKKLLDRDDIAKILSKFKNIDSRGHPVLPWEVNDGVLVLRFYDPDEHLTPNILTLQEGVSSIESYLEKMAAILKALEEIKDSK